MPQTTLTGKSSDLLKVVLPAAARGDLNIVRRFIADRPAWLYEIGPHGRTMLWEATYKGRFKTVEFLLSNGADLNSYGTYYTPLVVDLTPYALARHLGLSELENLFVESGALIDIHTAAYFGEVDLVKEFIRTDKKLVDAPANIFSGKLVSGRESLPDKATLEKLAEITGHLKKMLKPEIRKVRSIVDSKNAIKVEKNLAVDGCGTEYWPEMNKIGDLIQDVVNSSLSINLKNATIQNLHKEWHHWREQWRLNFLDFIYIPYVHTTLDYAVQGRQIDVLRLLIENGANIKKYGNSLLKKCNLEKDQEIFSLLVKSGARTDGIADAEWHGNQKLIEIAKRFDIKIPDINARVDGKFPWLTDECRGNHNATDDIKRVQYVLSLGADVNATDYKGKTALHRASQAGFTKITNLLLDNNANIEFKDNSGETPLFDAIRYGRLATTKLLLERGADIKATNSKGRDLIYVAKRSKKKEADRILKVIENWN